MGASISSCKQSNLRVEQVPGKPGFRTALSLPYPSLCFHPGLNPRLGLDDLSEWCELVWILLFSSFLLPSWKKGHFTQRKETLALSLCTDSSGPTNVEQPFARCRI